jgi:hypothetical protein
LFLPYQHDYADFFKFSGVCISGWSGKPAYRLGQGAGMKSFGVVVRGDEFGAGRLDRGAGL